MAAGNEKQTRGRWVSGRARVGYSVFFLFPVVVVWRYFEKRRKGPAKASLVAVPVWVN